MELRHFRYFIAVAQDLHFTRAAARLGISTPTLTRQIQEMEASLGIRLFERNQRSVALTPAGEVLLAEAQAVVAQFEAAQLRAQREARGETGKIHVGYVASAAYSGVLQRQVAAFRKACPDVQLLVREAPMGTLPEQVRDGQVDIAYIRSPMNLPEGVDALPLAPEGFILALHSDSWLCGLAEIQPAHLKAETFILPEQVSGTLSTAEQGGFVPRLGPQPGGLVAVLTLVSLGEGVAIVPNAVAGHISLPSLVYRDIAGLAVTSYLSLMSRQYEKAATIRRYIELVSRPAVTSGRKSRVQTGQ
ncbi:LysR family transcriptional regulator [Cupriavidus basilensis]|uniref:LysR family transcriptional regulator n=1 Tax=Cupriavidus basilensis TaxID=68895 RepID=UPI0039F65DAA